MKKAVFTMMSHEEVMLPIWLSYYSRYFKGDDIYVLTHNSKEEHMRESREKFKFNELPRNYGEIFNTSEQLSIVKQFQKELLATYDYVLYTDIDEIVVPDPDLFTSLSEFIDQCNDDYVYAKGYEVIHNRDLEPALDLSQPPLLQQRKYWAFNINISKPLLSRISLSWINGFHQLEEDNTYEKVSYKINPRLYLLHLKRMDWDIAKDRFEYTGYSKATTTHFDGQFLQYHDRAELIPERFRNII